MALDPRMMAAMRDAQDKAQASIALAFSAQAIDILKLESSKDNDLCSLRAKAIAHLERVFEVPGEVIDPNAAVA